MIYNKKVTAIVLIKAETEKENGSLRLFNGKPLYHTLIDKLESIFAIDEILVDSDMPEIKDALLSMYNKVKFIPRPASLSGSDINVNQIIAYDLAQTQNEEIFIQTHVNKPLLKSETIAKALKKFAEQEEADSLFSVNTYQNRFYDDVYKPINHDMDNLVRTRDLKPVYEENSCFYIFTKESFSLYQRRIGNRPYLYNIPSIEALELKDGLSYKLAEILMLYQEL
jgi:CMP-N-acetylneuraminic acid synthetase